ncbi:hypothetical protein BHE74_00024053 [Ensete ventricosum]|nr:hypothetical protein GW17_00028852 [Ensete ventricosum]RWW68425.1 hypothetical protein BHE74_00024053 [Ensete ventricosum]RZS03147.1 hypothetical protein BHM03_00033290 [Ensete ventricosum]
MRPARPLLLHTAQPSIHDPTAERLGVNDLSRVRSSDSHLPGDGQRESTVCVRSYADRIVAVGELEREKGKVYDATAYYLICGRMIEGVPGGPRVRRLCFRDTLDDPLTFGI